MNFIFFALGFVPALILAHDDEFCYDDPNCDPGSSAWGNVCSTEKSEYQSPIIFDTAKITYSRSQQALQLNGAYASNASFVLHNTGHTVTITPVDTSNQYACGDLLRGNCYTFAHIHFHWGSHDNKGSEHWIDGRQFPMEAHFVHYKSQYASFKDALESSSDPTALAVFGLLYEVQSEQGNIPLKLLTDRLDHIKEYDSQTTIHDLNLRNLYPKRYFRRHRIRSLQYLGSLTTPFCNESVLWNVFLTPLPIASTQMVQFRKLTRRNLRNETVPLIDNFRLPLQQNNRVVECLPAFIDAANAIIY